MPDYFDPTFFPRDGDSNGYGGVSSAAVPAPAPRVDPTRDYVSGGHGFTPLVGQYVLSRSIDDLAADLGHEVYRVMEHDPTVRAAVGVLVGGVLAGPLQVQPNHRHRPEAGEDVGADPARAAKVEEAQRWADLVRRSFLRVEEGVDQVTRANLKGARRGSIAQEVTCEPGAGEDAGKVVLRSVRPLPPRAWAFVVDGAMRPVAIRAAAIGGATWADLPLSKFLVCTFDPEDGDPRGRSLLRSAYNGWNLKVTTWPKYLKYLHTAASPTPVAKYDPMAPDEVVGGVAVRPSDVLAAALERGIGGEYFVVPIGTEMMYVQPQGNGEAFLKAIELFKTEIIEGIIVAARAIKEAKFGSRADSQGAMDVVGDAVLALKAWDCRAWDSLAYRLVLWNSDAATAAEFAPECTRGDVSPAERAGMMDSLVKTGWKLDPTQFPWADAQAGAPVRKMAEIQAQQAQQAEMAKAQHEAQVAVLAAKAGPKGNTDDGTIAQPAGPGPEAAKSGDG